MGYFSKEDLKNKELLRLEMSYVIRSTYKELKREDLLFLGDRNLSELYNAIVRRKKKQKLKETKVQLEQIKMAICIEENENENGLGH